MAICVLALLSLVVGLCWAVAEQRRRCKVREELGGWPTRSGSYKTSLLECCQHPRLWMPAFCFTPFLAAFNRAEVEGRECNGCDVLFSLKTPITQYHTRQSLRSQQRMQEEQCTDALSAICCTPCAVAQDALEMEKIADDERVTVSVAQVAPTKEMDQPKMGLDEAPPGYSLVEVPKQCEV